MIARITVGLTLGALAAGVAGSVAQPGFATNVTALEGGIQQKVGVELAIAGIYLEESGVPLPMPSEVSIGYLGQRINRNPPALFGAWLGLTALIVLGSTNLFAASRRFGPRLVCGRIGMALHLTPAAVARAQRWFARWGPLAIGVSRYIPGLRWGMAVACGTIGGVSYRTFWLSTAISASIWAGGLLTLGVTMGDAVGRQIADHVWLGLLLPLPAATVVTTGLIRLVVLHRSGAAAPSI
ncbi:MAG TPA: VTT domain-containing protein [Candidatus Dormibacteraeota bacterium]|nr:VTT domain-containing protein [Candidatus Dormibacteraeota bacterium]